MPTRRTATTTKNIGNYFRIAADGRLIWGGRARFALSSPASDAKSGRILERSLRETFPQLGPVQIDYCWGGIIDLTADRLPRAGEHDGLFYAMDYSGHGAQMSVHMGQQMAAVLGGEASANPFSRLDWPAIPGHFGPPWFMPFVGAYLSAAGLFALGLKEVSPGALPLDPGKGQSSFANLLIKVFSSPHLERGPGRSSQRFRLHLGQLEWLRKGRSWP